MMKRKLFSRLLSAALATAMLANLAPATALAAPGDGPSLDTIQTVDSASRGIHLNLFDYNGTEANEYDNYLSFVGSNATHIDGRKLWNSWKSGRGVIQGVVQPTMQNSNTAYPRLANGTSLSYLFSPKAVNDGEGMVSARTGLNHLFYQDGEGYYIYDAAKNFATIVDNNDKNFKVYRTPYKPGDTAPSTPKFLPLNDLKNSQTLNSNANYHFGLSMDFNFMQPKNGKIGSRDMVFEFTGDDDVWIYIDGVLVLDMGGIHDAMSGSINFATGQVAIDHVYTSRGGNRVVTKSLYEIMREAKGQDYVDKNFVKENGNWVFQNYSSHSFRYYYMERGAGGSNCRIKFNLQSIPDETILVRKQITETNMADFADADFQFKVELKNGDSYAPYTGSYTVYTDVNGSAQKVREGTTSDGTFTLKHGQYAALADNIKANTVYRASEIGAYSDKYEVIVNSTTAKAEGPDGSTQVYQSEDLVVEENPAVTFENRCLVQNLYNLSVEKVMQGAPSDESFDMQVQIGGKAYAGEYYLMSREDSSLDLDSGVKKSTSNGIIPLKADEKAVIPGVVWGSSFQVVEVSPGDNYLAPQYQVKNATSTDTDGKGAGKIPEGVVQTERVSAVTVTNQLKKADLTIRKVIEGDLSAQELANLQSRLTFVVTDASGEPAFTVKGDNPSGRWDGNTFTYTQQLLPGQYTLSETGEEVEGYDVSVDSSNATVTLRPGKPATLTLVNSYRQNHGTLRIYKQLDQVKLEKGDPVFSFKLTGGDGVVHYYHIDMRNSAGNGRQLVAEIALPIGSYRVEELENLNYTLADIAADDPGHFAHSGAAATVCIGFDDGGCQQYNAAALDREVTFQNRYSGGDIPTDSSATRNVFKVEDGKLVFIVPKQDDLVPSPDERDEN